MSPVYLGITPIILLGALATASPAAGSLSADELATMRCEREIVCIRERQSGDDVELLAHNLANFPVTLSVYARLRNYVAEPGRSLSRVLEAGETQRVMILRPRRPDASKNYRYWFDWSPGRLNAVHDDAYLYRLPYASGESFRVLQGFGSRFSHKGVNRYAVDFDMPVGTPVHAARAGVVVQTEARHNKGCWEDGCGKYANFIVVLHDDGTTGEYFHLRQNGVLVSTDEQIRKGQLIAYSGNTGHTTTPHLHFAVYRPGTWGKFESIPVRFRAREGLIKTPRRGGRYTAD